MNGSGSLARSIAAATLALIAHACSTPAEPLASTDEVEQHADGCGAYRYRGAANVTCDYRGRPNGPDENQTVGTCINDSELSCSFGITCTWDSPSVGTVCSDSSGACDNYPPEASIFDPPALTFRLDPGSTLCDPPAAAKALTEECWKWRYVAGQMAWQICQEQTSRNSGSVTCCQPCANPTPLPGMAAGDACADGDCGCALEPAPDAGTPDAGAPDAGISAL